MDCIAQTERVMPSRDLWEKNSADFEACDGIPVKRTKEYTWKQTQFSSGPAGLDAKIKKEIEANEGDIVWKDTKARLLDCIEQKKELCPAETCGRRIAQTSKHETVCL